jgi:uncharacterized membrane protein YjjB (DUF3815 family)
LYHITIADHIFHFFSIVYLHLMLNHPVRDLWTCMYALACIRI